MIRICRTEDSDLIHIIVNQAARAYEGFIPPDCYHQPYMPMDELLREMDRMTFFGWQEGKLLMGVMGLEGIKDVYLVRHAYVLPDWQSKGVGGKLIQHILELTNGRRLLVGTWAGASWAIEFYEKHGFVLLPDKDELLKKYWQISDRQIETSVVLGKF